MRVLIACSVAHDLSPDLVAGIAARSDAVIAADGGADILLQAGVTPDLLVGDMDSIDESARERLALDGVRAEVHPAEKDASDLDLALDAARRLGADSVVVLGALGERLDHQLAVIGSLALAADLAPELVSSSVHVWVLSVVGRHAVEVPGRGSRVSVMAIAEGTRATSAGLRWPLDGIKLSPFSSRGLSNEVVAATALVRVISGSCLVIHNRLPMESD